MISPTIGRVVWFHPGKSYPNIEGGEQPLAALVTYVHSDTMVNLAVFDGNGKHHALTSIWLKQGDANTIPGGSAYAEWMPYQLGQAARTEAALAGVKQS